MYFNKKVPRSGFIDVRDFNTVKDLADYLKYLDRNSTAYNSYFNWKRFVQFDSPIEFGPICDMCIYLQLDNHFGIKKSVSGDLWNRKN